MSEDRKLASKLAEIMAAVGHVPKKGRNQFQNYDYVRETDIVDAVSKLMAERHIALIPKVGNLHFEPITTAKGTPGYFAVVTMQYTFVDGETGEEFTVEAVGAGTDQPGDKAFYKAATGAKKYALTQTFLIATGDDPEDERAETPRAKKRAQNNPTASPQQQGKPAEQAAADTQERLRGIQLRKAIRQQYTQDQEVKDGSIAQMSNAEMVERWPDVKVEA